MSMSDEVTTRFGVQFRPTCMVTNWVMAEDYYFECSPDTTFEEIKLAIHAQRPHISTARMILIVKEKEIPESKMSWTLRRNAVKNNEVIIVAPTMYDGWFWETRDFYREEFLRRIAMEVIAEPAAVLSLDQVEKRVGALPRPIRGISVRALLRLYPEKFFLRHDTTSDKTWVMISDGMQIPVWQPSPVDMGMIKQYAPRRFDWEDYKSVDSMAKVVLDINKPGSKLRLHIQKLSNVRLDDPFKKPNPYCVYWWNNDAEEEEFHEDFNFEDPKLKVGETEICDESHNPEWDDGDFIVQTGQLGEIDVCALKIEVYHASLEVDEDEEPGEVDETGRNRDFDELVGVVKLMGRDILSVTQKGAIQGNRFPILPLSKRRVRGTKKMPDPVGFIQLGGGKGEGYEVAINCARAAKEFREKITQRALVVAIFNGQEVGVSPIAGDAVDPGWVLPGRMGEVINIKCPENMAMRTCELELQLWVTDPNAGRGKYIGSSIFAGKKLEDLVGILEPKPGETELRHRKHAEVFKEPMVASSSPTIPREKRNPVGVQGFMTVIGGTAGLPRPATKILEVAVMQVNNTNRINFISARVTWNDIRYGISGPARLHDQDWLSDSSYTEYKWSRNREKHSAQFYIPLEPHKRTSQGSELRVEIFETEHGENYVDMSGKRLATLSTDPKGKSYLPRGSPEEIHASSRDVHGGASTVGDDSATLISGRPKAYEHKDAALGQYLGLARIKGEELQALMDGKFAVAKEFALTLDYDRDALFQKRVLADSKIIILGGPKGARQEEERIFTIDGLDMLNLYGLFEDTAKAKREAAAAAAAKKDEGKKSTGISFGFLGGGGDGGGKEAKTEAQLEEELVNQAHAVILPDEDEPVDLFCVVYWNAVEVGRTQIVTSTTGAVVFENEHFYVPLTAPANSADDPGATNNMRHRPVQNTFTCRLEVEVIDSREGSLGYLKLDGRKVGTLLEAKAPQSQIHDLTFSTRFPSNGRAVCKGKIKLSTCGLEITSPYQVDDAKAAQKARQEAALKKQKEKEEKAAKKAADKAAKKEAKKKAKAEAKAKALAKEAALAAADGGG